jgi:predicted GNAT family acetyltransferase
MPEIRMQDLTDNTTRQRFELIENGYTAFADYRREGSHLVIRHVEAPPELRGKGTAGRLMEAIVAQAQTEGAHIVPLCGYARAWLKRHPEHSDIVTTG